jgi:hypothetical protein
MSQVRAQVRDGGCPAGGIVGYPLDRLYGEVAFLAYHFHWPYEEIMQMEHRERRRWCEEISKINKQLNEQAERR